MAEIGLRPSLPHPGAAVLEGILLTAMQDMLETPSLFGSLFSDKGKLAPIGHFFLKNHMLCNCKNRSAVADLILAAFSWKCQR